MNSRTVARLGSMALATALLAGASGCKAAAAPSPVLATENFNGTVPALGIAPFHTISVKYAFAATDLSATLASVSVTPAITLGIGFGTISGTACAVQVSAPAATVGQELFAPNGATAGTYCIVVFDNIVNGVGTVTDSVNYSLTVKHY